MSLESSTGILYKPRAYVGVNIWTMIVLPFWIEGLLRVLEANVASFGDILFISEILFVMPVGSIALLTFFIFLTADVIRDFSYSSPFSIQISERGISGPVKKDKKESFFKSKYDFALIAFEDINWDKSFQDAQFGYKHVYSKSGKIIFLHPGLGPTQLNEIETQCRKHVS
ncbi:MAG: hypothetical protein AAF569_09590 [Pseudomonadota bacterium]